MAVFLRVDWEGRFASNSVVFHDVGYKEVVVDDIYEKYREHFSNPFNFYMGLKYIHMYPLNRQLSAMTVCRDKPNGVC